ncbi:MAG: ferrous iron transport protein A [Spirochaetia bacterium]|nr:ferrous iron transport protein A [Spirochaetia bacterium]
MGLKQMSKGDKAILTGFSENGSAYRRKLLSMGLTRGVEIEFVQAAPMGDPIEIKVRGYALSLRRAEAEVLQLRGVDR